MNDMKLHINRTEFNKFVEILKFQNKDLNDVLNDYIKKYNDEYNDDYEKSIEYFWNNMVNENKK